MQGTIDRAGADPSTHGKKWVLGEIRGGYYQRVLSVQGEDAPVTDVVENIGREQERRHEHQQVEEDGKTEDDTVGAVGPDAGPCGRHRLFGYGIFSRGNLFMSGFSVGQAEFGSALSRADGAQGQQIETENRQGIQTNQSIKQVIIRELEAVFRQRQVRRKMAVVGVGDEKSDQREEQVTHEAHGPGQNQGRQRVGGARLRQDF